MWGPQRIRGLLKRQPTLPQFDFQTDTRLAVVSRSYLVTSDLCSLSPAEVLHEEAASAFGKCRELKPNNLLTGTQISYRDAVPCCMRGAMMFGCHISSLLRL